MTEILLAVVLGPFLWLTGAIVFDGAHWVLHLMLRSRFALLRTLARPHGVHHEWIDRNLTTNWDLQSANIWCHIVPEYMTQLVFTGLVALVLPLPFAVVLLLFQTLVFLGILRAKGRDINHRPTPRIDAHPPGWATPPSYHLLHHVWPDAYFSAYTKAVDWIVGGGTQVAERRFGWHGSDPVGVRTALGDELERAGAQLAFEAPALGALDVLIVGDAEAPLADAVEPFIQATRDHQLAPEVWALRSNAADPVARHYLRDPRVVLRTLLVPAEGGGLSHEQARAVARRAVAAIRRDAHFVSLGQPAGWAKLRRYLRTEPVVPEGAELVRHRIEFAADS